MTKRNSAKNKIKLLEVKLANHNKEFEKFEAHKISLIQKAQNQKRELSSTELTKIGEESIQYRRKQNTFIYQLRILQTTSALFSSDSLIFDRIIVGGGITATLLYNAIPPQNRRATDGAPLVIVLDDKNNPQTWLKEKQRLMGQSSSGHFSSQLIPSDSFSFKDSPETNPYNYVVAENFYASILESQNNLNMPMVNLKALEIQSRDDATLYNEPWLHTSYKHRILVTNTKKKQKKYLYTQAIDLCTGLGPLNKLNQNQIKPELEQELLRKKKIHYSQDGDINLKNDVVFYGGSAINAAWIAEIRLKNKIVKPVWITPRASTFERVKKLNRIIALAMSTYPEMLFLGTLETVSQEKNGKLKLTFSSYSAYPDQGKISKIQEIFCDQLMISMGQQSDPLTKNLKNFKPAYYKSVPLGTYSEDGSIVTWGAAGVSGVGLSQDEIIQYTKAMQKHANSMPHETQALGGIARAHFTIPRMVDQLQEAGQFPFAKDHQTFNFFPDINLASQTEIIQILKEYSVHSIEQCTKFAEEIIDLRGKQSDIHSNAMPGISSSSLQTLCLPTDILKVLNNYFFPYEQSKIRNVNDFLLNKSPQLNLTFFSGDRHTQDAQVPVSNAKISGSVDLARAVKTVSRKLGTTNTA